MDPTFNDYIRLLYNRFEAFVQSADEPVKRGKPYIYQHQSLIVFFMWMQFKKVYQFKTQQRWLKQHPAALSILKWAGVPDRNTLSRRYKALYGVIQAFSAFLGQASEPLGEEMTKIGIRLDCSAKQ